MNERRRAAPKALSPAVRSTEAGTMSARGWFVSGTDTEVGKTTVTAGLLVALAARGLRFAPVKPLAAGQAQDASGRWFNEDVRALHIAQSLDLGEDEVGPLQWRHAVAPHIAAQLEQRPIRRDAVLASVQRLAGRGDGLLVEGVGGFCVPLLPGWTTADLADEIGLPVLLVVGLRLGCINHALLTAEAVLARGLPLAGWVGNTLDPHMAQREAVLATLAESLDAPCWGVLPRLPDPTAAAVAEHLDLSQALAGLQPKEADPCSTRS